MTALTATYRLQFREGMTFAGAAALAPYLRDLGVSHLYASPVFRAVAGSTHGYDVADHTEFDPALGGMAGFVALSDALRAAGLGLILDIVPNHMAFSTENPWLCDVLRHGPDSRYSRHFDIDWSQDRLVMPLLGAPFATLNATGAFGVERRGETLFLAGPGVALPLRPDLPAGIVAGDHYRLTPEAIARVHDAQHWRLTDWRLERDGIVHRRFFAVTSLIGVRVEDPAVFEDVHALIFAMADQGRIQGIRIDHIDGLADPAAYLGALKARIGDLPIWVEKILTGDEPLPDWPVVGTTGYEAGAALTAVLTDRAGALAIDRAYRRILDHRQDFDDMLLRAKRQLFTDELAAELLALSRMIETLASQDPVGRDFGPDTLRRALIELCAAFPVYRTYLTATPATATDRAVLDRAAAEASGRLSYRPPLDFIVAALTGGAAPRFAVRFQQVTGALMAKSKEDTAFFRFNRLLSANEVGSEPEVMNLTAPAFHAAMQARHARQPMGLTLTSSHDTKRSADARMRVAAITHAPREFAEFVAGIDLLPGGAAIPPHVRWYLCQTLLAVWEPGSDLGPRLEEHMRKALREAKEFTSWIDPDPSFEVAVLRFAATAARHCAQAPPAAVGPILAHADRLALIHTALALLMPGIPDIYQGNEAADFSLTDPDNRRPPGFEALRTLVIGSPTSSPLTRRKNALTRACLALRKAHPEVFLAGEYVALDCPPGALGFERRRGGIRVRVRGLLDPDAAPVSGRDAQAAGEDGFEVIFGPQDAVGAEGGVDWTRLREKPLITLATGSGRS